MKNVLADRNYSQSNSVESKKKSRQDVIEFRDRLSQSLINNSSDSRWTKGDPKTQNTTKNGHKRLPQPSSQGNRLTIWKRISQGAKWTVFSVVAIAIAAMVLYEPSPSKKQQQPENANNPSESMPMPPLELPNSLSPEAKPLPNTALPPLSPQQEGLGKQPLTLGSSQQNLDQPLSVNPSADQIPSLEPDLSSEPSLAGRDPVIPPTLPPNLPEVEPPCAGQGTHPEESSAAIDTNTNTGENSPVLEVKDYFKKGWQPPAGIKQTLEYTVSINADGTIGRIRPLSNAAGTHIDRTNLPLPGSAFVSAKEGGGNTNIYLAFSPDGTVKASLE